MHATAGAVREYYGIQALRAIAALAVVAGHSTDYLEMRNGAVPGPLQWIHGPAGVDIFFVISGFVMMISAGRLLTKANPAGVFLWRRLLRIAPLYWLLTLAKLVLITAWPALSVHARPSHWNVVSSFFFIPSVGPSGEIRPLIPVGWTLSFEMFFYVLFAAGLWMIHRRRGRAASGELLKFLVPAIFAVALLGVVRTEAWPAWTAVADPIVLEFLAGAVLAWIALRSWHAKPWIAGGLICGGFVGLGVLSPGMTGGFWAARVVVWGIPAVMIVYGVVSLEDKLRKRLPGWVLLLGSASYAIYLIQTFVFPLVHAVMDRYFADSVHESPVEAGLLMVAMSLPLVAVAGVAVHLMIERRMTDFLKSQFGTERISQVLR